MDLLRLGGETILSIISLRFYLYDFEFFRKTQQPIRLDSIKLGW